MARPDVEKLERVAPHTGRQAREYITDLEADRDTWKARAEEAGAEVTARDAAIRQADHEVVRLQARAEELERALVKYGHHKRSSCRPSDLKPNLIWDRRGYSDNCKPDCGFSAALSKQEPAQRGGSNGNDTQRS